MGPGGARLPNESGLTATSRGAMRRLAGKAAVVTGAGRGIGKTSRPAGMHRTRFLFRRLISRSWQTARNGAPPTPPTPPTSQPSTRPGPDPRGTAGGATFTFPGAGARVGRGPGGSGRATASGRTPQDK